MLRLDTCWRFCSVEGARLQKDRPSHGDTVAAVLTVAVHDGGMKVAKPTSNVAADAQDLAQRQAAVGAVDDVVQAARQ